MEGIVLSSLIPINSAILNILLFGLITMANKMSDPVPKQSPTPAPAIHVQAMRVFALVAQLASFTRAADALGMPKARVSLLLQQLEQNLGARLLHRTTRRVTLTQDGETFLARCLDLLEELDELHSLFRAPEAGLRGRLRVDMPNGVAQALVMPALPAFLAAHPDLELEFGSTDRRVDLVREGYDCVLRVGRLADSALIARPLGEMVLFNCASPAYLQRHGIPQTPEDLPRQGHQLVHYLPQFGAHTDGFVWCDATGERHSIALTGRVRVNNSDNYLQACVQGLGIIQVPAHAVLQHLQDGRLCRILPDWQDAPMPVHLLYASRRQMPRRVQVFANWLAQVLQPALTLPSAP